MVGPDGALPLPWLAEPLRAGIARGAHALLVSGPEGVGQFELGLTLAQAWLCEAPAAAPARPCGVCGSCRLVQAHSHPDLLVLLPEAMRETLGWETPGGEGEGAAEKTGKAKPSKEIKVEAVRMAVEFAQTTSARGRGKVVVLHPAEQMNIIAATTLLKTLEEPPGHARFVLGSAAPDALLPTIRSRCQSLPMTLPPVAAAIDWLASRGVAEAAGLLAACGGRPLQALQWSEEGIDAELWKQLPALVMRGEATVFLSWPLPRFIETLQKLCHDALCVAAGGSQRYFPAGSVGRAASVGELSAWSRDLNRIALQADHPWSAPLLIEALVDRACKSLANPGRRERNAPGHSLHSPP